jgi:serine protease Do
MSFKRAILIGIGSALLAFPGCAQNTAPRGRAVVVRRSGTGYLGIGVIELTDERAKALNLKDSRGVEVKRVEENSAAAKAGIKENDVILEINGKPVDGVDQFIRSIGDMQPGTKVDMTVWRNGARQTLTATLESRPRQLALFGPNGDMVQMPPIPPMPPMPSDMDPWSILPGSARVGFEGEMLSPQLAELGSRYELRGDRK